MCVYTGFVSIDCGLPEQAGVYVDAATKLPYVPDGAYTDAGEKQRRLEVYRKNVELIEEFNSGGHSYTLTDNKFADLTSEEFAARYTGL